MDALSRVRDALPRLHAGLRGLDRLAVSKDGSAQSQLGSVRRTPWRRTRVPFMEHGLAVRLVTRDAEVDAGRVRQVRRGGLPSGVPQPLPQQMGRPGAQSCPHQIERAPPASTPCGNLERYPEAPAWPGGCSMLNTPLRPGRTAGTHGFRRNRAVLVRPVTATHAGVNLENSPASVRHIAGVPAIQPHPLAAGGLLTASWCPRRPGAGLNGAGWAGE